MTKQKKSTFKVLFYLKKNNLKKNGMAPIMGRITIDGEIAQFSTKLECDPDQWDLKFGRIFGRSDEATVINKRLITLQGQIHEHYHAMIRDKGFASARIVKSKLLGISSSGELLLDVYQDVLSEMKKMVEAGKRSFSTLENLTTVKNHVENYLILKLKRNNIAFREIDKKFLRGFELFLRTETKHICCNNTTYLYILLLNQVVNEAVDREIIKDNLVSKYLYHEMEKEETDICYLTKLEIKQLAEATFTWKNDICYRDFYLFGCFTGLAYSDLKNLTWDKIQQFSDGSWWIISKRQKSKIPFPVKLLDTPWQIMNKYKGLAKDNYVLPIPCYSTYRKALLRIAEQAGIDKRMTSHTARHTFATLFLTEGVPIESISKMMGHKSIKTTQIYAKITNEKINSDMSIATTKLKSLEQSISIAI